MHTVQRTTVFLILAMLSLGSIADEATRVPRIPMPETVHHIFYQTLTECPADRLTENERQENLDALENLRAIGWPDFSKLKWIRFYEATDPHRSATAWLLPTAGIDITLLLNDLTEIHRSVSTFARIETSSYEDDELAEILNFLAARPSEDRRPWDFTVIWNSDGSSFPFHQGTFMVYQAYIAACFDKQDIARQLLLEALRESRLAIKRAYDEGAWQSFARGIGPLERGAPRSAVLAHWQTTLKEYGNSSYRAELAEMTEMLAQQVKEDQQLEAITDPSKLSPAERAAYDIAHFPDVHGFQMSQPGMCLTTGMGTGTKDSDAVVAIGRPAVPLLIAHLTDRRLTRSIGFWRNFNPQRTVLRVQDVAVECIERILDIDFYRPTNSSAYLSTETPAIHDRVVEAITKWWAENGGKSPLAGYLALLDDGPFSQRLRNLQKIEKLDPHAVDIPATLKRWASAATVEDALPLAIALAQRGDTSLLPLIRNVVAWDKFRSHSDAVTALLRYGDASDYRICHAAALEDLQAGGKRQEWHAYGMVANALTTTRRPLGVPLLIDFLSDRRETTVRKPGATAADDFITVLIALTGHNEGYEAADVPTRRFAAIDRWLVWWRKTGLASYLKVNPEVKGVLKLGN